MELLILPPNLLTLSTDFRFNNWGDKIEDVIKKEGREPDLRSDTLLYYENVQFGSFSANINYAFEYTRLYLGSIEIKSNIKDLNEYTGIYWLIKKALQKSLNSQGETNEEWSNDRYRFNNAMHGYAISIGDYSILTQWLFPANNIFLQLNNEEEPICLRLGAMAPKH